ncbi:hypothetical protein AGOR_G00066770 [Albula goreensis]|uniref:BHLH domain-containing protein n=1 Tax=Albula goreensis TaxID=1534307 RepID=A0A8T3DS37_9TELE|nr:hypothetical protein AGOR_G00066770 [Albula goreensis]
MLQSFSPSRFWDYDSEPLLFDEEFCQILMKDLQTLPTPPQSPPIKSGLEKPLSKVDQLEFVSELLLEDHDLLGWNYDGIHKDVKSENDSCKDQQPDVSEDCLWHCLGDKFAEDKLSSVLSSPLLSNIDTSIFEEIAGSTLDCHSGALECQNEDLLQSISKQIESSSDYSSPTLANLQPVIPRRRLMWADAPQPKRARGEHHRTSPPSSAGRPRHHPHGHHSQHHAAADPEDEEERRRTHNVMERQRRNELKNCFLRLRDRVPELSNNDKASKVVILKKARDSIRGLEAESLRLAAKRDKLKQRQELLKARLEELRR